MSSIGICPVCGRTGPLPCPIKHPVSKKWADGHDLAASFRCLRSADPDRWPEVHRACKSRRFRKWWLGQVRSNIMFRVAKIMRAC